MLFIYYVLPCLFSDIKTRLDASYCLHPQLILNRCLLNNSYFEKKIQQPQFEYYEISPKKKH
jgi:hypothetical protein